MAGKHTRKEKCRRGTKIRTSKKCGKDCLWKLNAGGNRKAQVWLWDELKKDQH